MLTLPQLSGLVDGDGQDCLELLENFKDHFLSDEKSLVRRASMVAHLGKENLADYLVD